MRGGAVSARALGVLAGVAGALLGRGRGLGAGVWEICGCTGSRLWTRGLGFTVGLGSTSGRSSVLGVVRAGGTAFGRATLGRLGAAGCGMI